MAGLAVGCLTPAAAEIVTLGPSSDTTLYEDPAGDRSNGAGQHMFAGTNSGREIRRGLIDFDVASHLPRDSEIVGVTLTLHLSRSAGGPGVVSLRRAESAWGEGSTDAPGAEGSGGPATPGSATWLHSFYDDVFWSDPGGDIAERNSASREVGEQGGLYSWSSEGLAGDVRAWLSGQSPEHGWFLVADESSASSAKRFDTREHPEVHLRPILEIELVPAPGALWLIPPTLAAFAGRRKRRSSDSSWGRENEPCGRSSAACSRAS